MELKGKPLSLISKSLAMLIAVGGLVLKATVMPDFDIDASLKTSMFVALVFSPVDASMVINNVIGRR